MKFENKDGMICFSRIIELATESEAMKQKELERVKKEESLLGNADYLPSFSPSLETPFLKNKCTPY